VILINNYKMTLEIKLKKTRFRSKFYFFVLNYKSTIEIQFNSQSLQSQDEALQYTKEQNTGLPILIPYHFTL